MTQISELKLQTLNLSAKQIVQATGWPDFMVNDYLTNFQNSVSLSQYTDSNILSIEQNAINLKSHEDLNSAHGVTGSNVGNEDFASDLIGGVVLLMNLVNDAIPSTQEITLVDILPAPAAYDQAYMQTIADMANDTKAKHNQLMIDLNSVVTQLNDLIAKTKTAKQMSV